MNNIVTAKLGSSQNSFNIKSVTVNTNTVNPNLYDTSIAHESNLETNNLSFENINLLEKEYTYEELMKEVIDRRIEDTKITNNIEKGMETKSSSTDKEDGWKKFCDASETAGAYAATFVASAIEGFLDLGEGVVDAHIYTVAKLLQIGSWGESIITKYSDKAIRHIAGDGIAENPVYKYVKGFFDFDSSVRSHIAGVLDDAIAYDVSGKMYDGFVDIAGIDKDIAYGITHDIGNFGGEMVGYVALSAVPYVGTALCCIGGAGSSIEDSMNRQLKETGSVNDWVVFGESIFGCLEGLGFAMGGKAITSTVKTGANVIKEVGIKGLKELAKESLKSVGKETIKSTLKNGGKIALNAVAKTFTDADTYIETASVLGDDIVTGIETGEWDLLRMTGETAVVMGENYLANLGGNFFEGILDNSKKLKKLENIKNKFSLTYDLDDTDPNSKKIIDGFMNLVEKDKFTDENVKYLFENLDKLKEKNPKLNIGYWDSGSGFWAPINTLGMDVNDLDISEMVLSHELGHMIYDTVDGSAETNWQPKLTLENQNALSKARENISKNKEQVMLMLEESVTQKRKSFNETIEWYSSVKDVESKRVSDMVDELYATQNDDGVKKIVESGTKLGQVKEILLDAGLSNAGVDELISNKELVKEIAIIQNNINIQEAHYSKLNGSYEIYGDQRKTSAIIDSITQSDEGLKFSFGHKKTYWQSKDADLKSYNELLADYVSLSANGRSDALKKLEEVCGSEIFDDIRSTLANIVKKLGG